MNKNTIWIIAAIGAGIFGLFLGPALARTFSLGTLILLMLLFLIVFGAYIFWALSKNKSAATADEAQQADAKAMKAAPGKARIYMTRRGFVASMQGMNITIAGVAKGQIKSGQMLMAEVNPGTFNVNVGTANASMAKGVDMDVTVAAGDVVVLAAAFEMGAVKGQILLTKCDAATARDNVNHNKLMLWETTGA